MQLLVVSEFCFKKICTRWEDAWNIKQSTNGITLKAWGCKTSKQHLHDPIPAQHLLLFPCRCRWGYPALHHNTPLHPTPPQDNILGARPAGFVAPYQLFNFPGSTTSSFSEAAACQPAAILWSGADIVCCRRIKPCMLSEKVLFLVLLFLFCSPTLRNYSYSNWLPLPARAMENNFFSSWGRRNCTM